MSDARVIRGVTCELSPAPNPAAHAARRMAQLLERLYDVAPNSYWQAEIRAVLAQTRTAAPELELRPFKERLTSG